MPHGEDLPQPSYASAGAAGCDLYAAVDGSIVIQPGETVCVPTGVAIALPSGYEGQVRPRSGLALREQLGMLNAPGTIDSDYRGEIMVILTNFSSQARIIHRGDRIAQLVVAKCEQVEWVEADRLPDTERGAGGFGHTGK